MIFLGRFRFLWGATEQAPEPSPAWGVTRYNEMCGRDTNNGMCGVTRSNTFVQRREATQS